MRAGGGRSRLGPKASWGALAAALVLWLSTVFAGPARAQDEVPEPFDLILILDASGSMWAQVPVQNYSRFADAQRVLGELFGKLPGEMDVGLVVYGHRRRGDCQDIETVVPLGPFDRVALQQAVDALSPLGKTPLTTATEQALDILRQRDEPAIVVLLTDGVESCGGDLAASVRAARAEGLEFFLEIVGFYVADEDAEQLRQAAAAGCGRYLGAGDTEALAAALEQVALERLRAIATVRDEFDYSPFFGDDGSAVWRFPWREFGEDDGPGDGGEIEVEVDRTCFDGPCLNVEADAGSEGVGAMREVDLSGVESAVLSFVYGHDGDAGSEIVFEVSADAGVSWTTLETYVLDRVLLGQQASFDLTPWAARRTQIRFRVTVAEWGDLGVDHLRIDYVYQGERRNVGDEFNAYSGNNGSRTWSGPWIENDDGDPDAGATRVTVSERCRAGHCLKLQPISAGADVYREADLEGALSATLSYHLEHLLIGDDAVALEVSADGGNSYTRLATYGQSSPRTADASFDLSPFIAADTRIRFRTAGSGQGKGMWIDDLEIRFTDPGSCGDRAVARTGT